MPETVELNQENPENVEFVIPDEGDAEEILRKREGRAEVREESADLKTGQITARVSQNKMLALPEKYRVGKAEFSLVSVSISEMEELEVLFSLWPDIIQVLALAEPKKGSKERFDMAQALELVTASLKARGQEADERWFKIQMRSMASAASQNLDVIVRTVLMLSPAGTTSDEIEAKLNDLTVADWPLLLRACMDAVGGFPGDLADSFGTP